jgi:hypothetical protein
LEDFSVENIISTVNKRDTNNPKRLKKKEPINEREEVRKRFAREYGRSINKRED